MIKTVTHYYCDMEGCRGKAEDYLIQIPFISFPQSNFIISCVARTDEDRAPQRHICLKCRIKVTEQALAIMKGFP